MSFSELILKRNFWIWFIIAVIIFLFLYGLLISNDNSELSKSKSYLETAQQRLTENEVVIKDKNQEISNLNYELSQRNEEIASLRVELNKKSEELLNYTPEITKKNNIISNLNSELNQKNNEISKLNSELTKKNKEISILSSNEIKKDDNKNELNYKSERSTNSHPYGIGNSRITIYSICGNTGAIKIWIDGKFMGTLTKYYFNDTPDCGYSGRGSVVNSIIRAGRHQISARSDDRRSWNFEISVREDECKSIPLKCRK